MGARPPWGEIPDTNIVPAGAYEIAVKELADTMSKASDTERAKLMYVAQLKIQSPKEYKGLMITDRFTIGTNDDPEGQDPETWKSSFAARRYRELAVSTPLRIGEGRAGQAPPLRHEGARQGREHLLPSPLKQKAPRARGFSRLPRIFFF